MLIRQGSIPDKRVVVIEDDASIAILIAAILADEGYTPFVVMDGRQALRAVKEVRPQVVTLDLEIPGLDGRAVLRRLAAEALEECPGVVVVSANADDLTRDDRRLVAHTIRKPFNLVELIEAVEDASERAAS